MKCVLIGIVVGICVCSAGTAMAEATVELTLLIRERVSPTAPQEWGRVLGRSGFSRPTIRSTRTGDEFGITERGSDLRPIYQVTGYLLADGVILLPPKSKFAMRDAGRLSTWVVNLKKNGPDAASGTALPFGLSPQRLKQVDTDLRVAVRQPTKGVEATEVVKLLGAGLRYPLRLDASATRALAIDGKVRDQLRGLSTGTALAAVLRPAGLVLRPRFVSGKLEYAIVDARVRGENWPIGWSSEKTPGKLIPALFDTEETVDVEVPLATALNEISSRVKTPFLLDHNGMAVGRIDPMTTTVTLRAGKSHFGGILNHLLRQPQLRYEVRVDDNQQPFLWITTLK
ncbi:MAG: hypothetical protein VB853_04500 [Pirellulales bacterium]